MALTSDSIILDKLFIRMRIIIIDLHCNDFFVRHMARIMANNRIMSFKHQFLLRYFLENNYEVYNLITNSGTTALFPFSRFTSHSHFCKKLESFYVERKNNLPIIKTISIKDIKPTDIVIAFLVKPYQIPFIESLTCYKMVCGNHFISIAKPVDLDKGDINAFVNEIDLSNNKFVNRYINKKKCDDITLPYVFANRFEVRKPFAERENKAMAVGTASTCEGINGDYDLYREFFHTNLIQLMRWEILEKKDEVKEWIDCYIGDIRSGAVKERVPKGFIDKIIWKFQSQKLSNQSDYTSFDMVETFNKYKMFTCPEELVGMPGIGAIEGIACGTPNIGIKHEMYDSLGLKPGVHYIAYDGTLEDMVKVIKEYQEKPLELEKIAQSGCEYVRSHFNEKAVLETFIKQLNNSYHKYLNKYN